MKIIAILLYVVMNQKVCEQQLNSSIRAKPDVVLRAILQHCDGMLQC